MTEFLFSMPGLAYSETSWPHPVANMHTYTLTTPK